MKEIGSCQAPDEAHATGCSGIGSTRDHFTPRALTHVLGWSHEETSGKRDEGQIQWLSPACHTKKDTTTASELYWVKMHGGGKTLWQHHNELVIFKKGKPKTNV